MRTCEIDGCDGKYRASGCCNKHYRRLREHGDPLYVKEYPVKFCKIPGCGREAKGRGYCLMHYRRFRKYGNASHLEKEHHGKTNTSEYVTWCRMKDRCYNLKDKRYKNYGGRGIKVCDRWRNSFSAFYEDMGKRPFHKAEIDRKDNDGNYDPGNCRWVTRLVNMRNQSTTKLTMGKAREIRHKHKNGDISIKELALIYNVCYSTIHYIITNKNWREEGS